MTLTTSILLLLLGISAFYGLMLYVSAVLPSIITKLTQNTKKEKESLFTKFFYF